MFDDVEREDERDEKMKLKVIPIALCIGTEKLVGNHEDIYC